MGADSKSKREQWEKVAAENTKCSRCPPHGGENATKKPRSDKHKNKRKRSKKVTK